MDTIKIKTVLSEEQRRLKAELLGFDHSEQQNPQPFSKANSSIKPDLLNTLLIQEVKKMQQTDSNKKIQDETQKKEHKENKTVEQEILGQQKEILRENQEILRQILKSQIQIQTPAPAIQKSAISPPSISPDLPQSQKIHSQKSDKLPKEIINPVMETLRPLMEELKSVKNDLKILKEKEIGINQATNVSGERVLELASEKGNLHSKMRDVRKKVNKIENNFKHTKIEPAHQKFLEDLNSKVVELERNLLQDRNTLAEKAESISRKEEIKKMVSEVEAKIDFVSAKSKIEERLGSNFSYKEFHGSINSLMAELSEEKLAFHLSKTQLPFPDSTPFKISAKELSSIAKKARPEVSVLDLKKQELGPKYSSFVASQYKSAKKEDPIKLALFKAKGFEKQIILEDERKITTFKPNYLKEISSKPKEAERDIAFWILREGQGKSILVNQAHDLNLFKEKIKTLDGKISILNQNETKAATKIELPAQFGKEDLIRNYENANPNYQQALKPLQEKLFDEEESDKNQSLMNQIKEQKSDQINRDSLKNKQIILEIEPNANAVIENTKHDLEANFKFPLKFSEKDVDAKEQEVFDLYEGLVNFDKKFSAENLTDKKIVEENNFKNLNLKLMAEKVVRKQLEWIQKKEEELKKYELERQAFKAKKEKIFKTLKEKSQEKSKKEKAFTSFYAEQNEEIGAQNFPIRKKSEEAVLSQRKTPNLLEKSVKQENLILSSEELLSEVKQALETTARFPENRISQINAPHFFIPDKDSHSESNFEDYCRQLAESSSLPEESKEISDFSVIDNYQAAILTPADLKELVSSTNECLAQNSAQQNSKERPTYKFVFKPKPK